jgi:hypothetical protein
MFRTKSRWPFRRLAQRWTADCLHHLPPQWVDDLEQAAVKGSDDRILQLVEALPIDRSDLGQQLTTWAQNFQFEAILTLLSDYDRDR